MPQHHVRREFRGPRRPSRESGGVREQWGQIGDAEASAVGKAVAAMHPGPETAIGKTVLCFRAVEMVSKLTLGDVGNEADMGCEDAQVLLHIGGREIATIPGAAEEGRWPLPFLRV